MEARSKTSKGQEIGKCLCLIVLTFFAACILAPVADGRAYPSWLPPNVVEIGQTALFLLTLALFVMSWVLLFRSVVTLVKPQDE